MENIDARETHESEIALCCHQQILLIFYRIKKIRNEMKGWVLFRKKIVLITYGHLAIIFGYFTFL